MDNLDKDKDYYFINENGIVYAGKHLILDLWTDTNLNNNEFMEKTLLDAAKAADATVLYSYFHTFDINGGISGVIVLAESHISVHSWPEENYAAFDIFMCGDAQPELAINHIVEQFNSDEYHVKTIKRGCKSEENKIIK